MSILLAALGVGLMLLGVLFLLAAGGQPHRLAVAAVGLVGGAALTGLGVRLHARTRAYLPATLEAEILALAARRTGRLTTGDLRAALGARAAAAEPVLARLCRDGKAERQLADGTEWFVFRDLLPRLAVRRCRHCRTELPLTETLASCPNCGGELRTGVEKLALGDDELYRMD